MFIQRQASLVEIAKNTSKERRDNEEQDQSMINQGQLQEWTEHSTLIFENLKPLEISKNLFNIIRNSS